MYQTIQTNYIASKWFASEKTYNLREDAQYSVQAEVTEATISGWQQTQAKMSYCTMAYTISFWMTLSLEYDSRI